MTGIGCYLKNNLSEHTLGVVLGWKWWWWWWWHDNHVLSSQNNNINNSVCSSPSYTYIDCQSCFPIYLHTQSHRSVGSTENHGVNSHIGIISHFLLTKMIIRSWESATVVLSIQHHANFIKHYRILNIIKPIKVLKVNNAKENWLL